MGELEGLENVSLQAITSDKVHIRHLRATFAGTEATHVRQEGEFAIVIPNQGTYVSNSRLDLTLPEPEAVRNGCCAPPGFITFQPTTLAILRFSKRRSKASLSILTTEHLETEPLIPKGAICTSAHGTGTASMTCFTSIFVTDEYHCT